MTLAWAFVTLPGSAAIGQELILTLRGGGPIRDIAVGANGDVWVVDKNRNGTNPGGGLIRKWTGGTTWDTIVDVGASAIGVGPKGQVWLVNEPGHVHTLFKDPPAPTTTTVYLHVYAIVGRPIYHTGVEVLGVEYYWDSDNKVHTCAPRGMDLPFLRTSPRVVAKDAVWVKTVLDATIARWNDGKPYSLLDRNCNHFSDDLLRNLGTNGVDDVYLESDGLRLLASRIPGSASITELMKKADGRAEDKALWDDIKKLTPYSDALEYGATRVLRVRDKIWR